MTWTQFWDMHSGGGLKEAPYAKIYIQADETEARVIFYNRFGHNPERVTCTCCGDDYSISEEESLAQLTAYHRNCASGYVDAEGNRYDSDATEWDREARDRFVVVDGKKVFVKFEYFEEPDLGHMKYGASKKECIERFQTLEQYMAREDVLVVEEDDINDEERKGSVPAQGYVWMD